MLPVLPSLPLRGFRGLLVGECGGVARRGRVLKEETDMKLRWRQPLSPSLLPQILLEESQPGLPAYFFN